MIDDREGLPITLSVLYLDLARRMGVTVVGVGLPGHFVVRHVPKEGEGKFIDVYERGELLTAEQAKKKAEDFAGREVGDDVLKPVTKKAIVVRMLHNLLGRRPAGPGHGRRPALPGRHPDAGPVGRARTDDAGWHLSVEGPEGGGAGGRAVPDRPPGAGPGPEAAQGVQGAVGRGMIRIHHKGTKVTRRSTKAD